MERGQLPDFGKIMQLAQKVASQIEKPSEFNEKRVLSEEEMTSAISKITKSVTEVVNPMMIQELNNNKKDKHRVPISKQKSKINFEEIKEESGIEEIETVDTEPKETKETKETKDKKTKRLVEIESDESEEDPELPLRTKDMTFTLTVSLEELYNGCRKKIAMRRQKIEDDKYVEEKKKLSIKIEPGMIEEQTIRFNHLADEKKGYETGDIVVTLDVEEHPQFIRDGNNLIMEKDISLYEVYNPVIYVKHLNGKTFKITGNGLDFFSDEDGMIKKVLGAGMPILGEPGKYGDLFIKFKCVNKTIITQEIIDMLHKYFPPLNDHQASSTEIIEEKTFEEVTETDLEFMDSDSDYSDSEYSDSEDSE
jgi:curved DNA-binding protein CbpA